MIEVERKFRPTEEQLAKLLEGAEFVGEEVLEDNLYDYPDYRLIKQYVRLRERNGKFELKMGNDELAGVSEEIEDEEKIKKHFQTMLPLREFITLNLNKVVEYKTFRKKYKKGEFSIDIDNTDFGYYRVEIELLVQDNSQIDEAQNKILELAQSCGLELQKFPSKRREYFRIVKPEVYKELYL